MYNPVPVPVQTPPVEVVIKPFKVSPATSAHTVIFDPALTVGALLSVTTMLSLMGLQEPFPVVVKVRVTLPAAVSVALGV